MYVNSAITSAVKIQVSSTERDYVRLSGLLKLSEYQRDIRAGKGDGYYISWGKPYLVITLAVIITDGKGVIKEGTYYKSDVLFNALYHNGTNYVYQTLLNELYDTLPTT
jgi:hypothetical protein